MNSRLLLAPFLLLLTAAAFAADLPAIPPGAIAKKKELLFSDDFERAELGPKWGPVVPTYALDHGTLKGTQTRVNTPATDGKPAIVGHQAVIGADIPTKDSVIEFRFRLSGAQSVTAEFDDRKYTGSHYGHLCMIRLTPTGIIMTDQAEGGMRNDIMEMAKDPARKAERAKLLTGRSVTFPMTIDPAPWHAVVLETAGDAMRVTLDGKPVSYLKSPGIAHPTKSKVEFGCMGQDGYFDDIKIYNAEPVQP